MKSAAPAPGAASEGLESWMHARLESLLLGDAQQHPRELLLFLRAQGLAKRMLMFPRHTSDGIERSTSRVRQVQRMGAPVLEVIAPFHQPAGFQLVHESNQPAGQDSQAAREGLLADAG